MSEQAGRCVARAGRAAVLAAAFALPVTGYGAAQASTAARTATTGNAASRAYSGTAVGPATAVERKMAAIVTAWSIRLNRDDNVGVAELYALPALIIQAPNAYRLKTRSEVALFFSLLPCAGKVVSISYHGRFATAVFRLGNRGTSPCDDPGALAAARFEIVKGKIVSWAQVAVPGHSSVTGQVA